MVEPAGKIRRLPSDLADQIAAGEVVERPASVVKELVENSLDAGATRVRVDIDQGGLASIRVTDDGEGMDEADARLAIERHATSKISHFDDLRNLGTFGFRGEALPSIASVARLTLLTRRAASNEGTEVRVDGGAAPIVRPAASAVGTSIEVRDLFFNVPARRKFLKATAAESANVGDVVLVAALCRPDVTFILQRDGKLAREYLRVTSRRERAQKAVGEERLEACLGEHGPVRVEAYLGAPERARSGAVALHLLVNGRPVKDRKLARAVAQAYGSVLEAGRYPVGVVYVEMPPELVDVNVHPQKAEVRFADGRAVYDAVTRELHRALGRAYAVPALGPSSRPWLPPPRTAPLPYGYGAGSGESERAAFFSGPALADAGAGDPWGLSAPAEATTDGERVQADSATIPLAARHAPDGPSSDGERQPFYGSLRFIAQVRATFLVCEGADGLYVLDQHAAAERVTFDRLRRAFASRSVATQRLLVPELVSLLSSEVETLCEHEAEALALGIEVRRVGDQTVSVDAVPALLRRAQPERLVRDLLAELSRAAGRPFGDAVDRVLATMACHGSVRAGDAMPKEQAVALLEALDAVDFSGHCPHGRPVITRLSFDELERRVGRHG